MEEKRKLILVGGGGHCKSVLDAAERMNCFDEIVITDPVLEKGSMVLGHKVAGTDDELPFLFKAGYKEAFVTVGSIKTTVIRRKITERLKEIGFKLPEIIDPSAVVSEHAEIGEGTFVGKNAVINADAKVGRMAIINSGAIIEHECQIGDFSHVSVGALLCGNVTVEDDVFIGAGSRLMQGIIIGGKTVVGMGSTVIRDVEKDSVCVGLVK